MCQCPAKDRFVPTARSWRLGMMQEHHQHIMACALQTPCLTWITGAYLRPWGREWGNEAFS